MIAVIDYGIGNLGAMFNMIRRIAPDVRVVSSREQLKGAHRIVLPGVGSFDAGMTNLRQRDLIGPLEEKVLGEKVAFLGICIGAELLARGSEEGKLPGLGWLDAEVRKFDRALLSEPLKVPHMGWNEIDVATPHSLFEEFSPKARFYFAHSFHFDKVSPDQVLAHTTYGYRFPSIVGKGNILGTQFHPEKSHRFGLQLLKNFIRGDLP